jgi:hypothetical protein
MRYPGSVPIILYDDIAEELSFGPAMSSSNQQNKYGNDDPLIRNEQRTTRNEKQRGHLLNNVHGDYVLRRNAELSPAEYVSSPRCQPASHRSIKDPEREQADKSGQGKASHQSA